MKDFGSYNSFKVVKELGISYKKTGNRISILCPKHNDTHFGSCVLTPNGCHCFACNENSSIADIIMSATGCRITEEVTTKRAVIPGSDELWLLGIHNSPILDSKGEILEANPLLQFKKSQYAEYKNLLLNMASRAIRDCDQLSMYLQTLPANRIIDRDVWNTYINITEHPNPDIIRVFNTPSRVDSVLDSLNVRREAIADIIQRHLDVEIQSALQTKKQNLSARLIEIMKE